jgi:endoglucanase
VSFEVEGNCFNGVIGTKPPHLQGQNEKKVVLETDKMFVDVGAVDRDQVEDMGIDVGSPFTIYHPFRSVNDATVMGKAFDDRVGCAILIEVLRRLSEEEHGPTIAVNFAVCEEVGLRGAGPGAFTLKPEMALVLENTAAGDMPGIPPERCPTELGKGPAITIADKSLIASPDIVSRLKGLAGERDLPYQVKKPLYGGTDAGKISTTGSGIPSGVLSVPCRYIHNGLSLLRISDLEACAELALAFCLEPK